MELKAYQRQVIADVKSYLELLSTSRSYPEAFSRFWAEKGVPVLGRYHDTIPGVPNLCLKVPTGGGKTFLACNAIKPIFESLPAMLARVVVWLVPSDAILTQTIAALKDPRHPYRQCIDTAFGSRVEVYTKQELLNGQNFNPTTVAEQLSIMVLSYDSFRGRGKEGLKAYQENSNLVGFARTFGKPGAPIAEADETALFQVINQLFPLVIVDESHHARTQLSLEMLRHFNPCFVLDLTATPRKESNVISYVDALQLKKENMVKLPVIVHNCPSQKDVLLETIALRRKLEMHATAEEEQGAAFIRPIALLQAESRGKEDNATFEKVREDLIELGVPAHHIAIRTADINELKHENLMSRHCEVRYIITVNALKEGWDCPFAFVLASLANRTSEVDVEQILGRILRLPYARANRLRHLNMSYVLTSSRDFSGTVKNIVRGLNFAGFSDKDFRTTEIEEKQPTAKPPTQMVFPPAPPHPVVPPTTQPPSDETIDEAAGSLYAGESETVFGADDLLGKADALGREYEGQLETDNKNFNNSGESRTVLEKMTKYRIRERWKSQIEDICLPQFFVRVPASLFHEGESALLSEEALASDFSLRGKSYDIPFDSVASELRQIDINEQEGGVPKVYTMSEASQRYMRELYDSLPPEARIRNSKAMMLEHLNKLNSVESAELRHYIDLIVGNMSNEELGMLERNPLLFASHIRNKIKGLLLEHSEKSFHLWIQTGKITCQPSYKLPTMIFPGKGTTNFPGSLYEGEDGEMNQLEEALVLGLTGLLESNVCWWHRNLSRKGFCINGFVNHYPDFIIRTASGKIVLIETKGDHLKNDDSRDKLVLGQAWANLAGPQYRYYMVFDDNSTPLPGAYRLTEFLNDIMKNL